MGHAHNSLQEADVALGYYAGAYLWLTENEDILARETNEADEMLREKYPHLPFQGRAPRRTPHQLVRAARSLIKAAQAEGCL